MEVRCAKCRRKQQLRQLHGNNELGASSANVTGAPRQQVNIFTGARRRRPKFPLDKLPEDILCHVYSCMPFKDAAHAACVSHGFLRWRRCTIIIFNGKILGLNKGKFGWDENGYTFYEPAIKLDDMESYAISKIDHTITNHSGIGVRVLKLQLFPCPNISAAVLDRWFESVIKPGIEEVSLEMPVRGRATIQSLYLFSCAFHPTVAIGSNRSLTTLHLYKVHIYVQDALPDAAAQVPPGYKLSKSTGDRDKCSQIPKLYTFIYGEVQMQISLGGPPQIKGIHLMGYNQHSTVCYARVEVPPFTPNAVSFILSSINEMISTPMVPIKFLQFKFLEIYLSESLTLLPSHGFFYLVSFSDTYPRLQTCILQVESRLLRDSIIFYREYEDLRVLRCIHDNLKKVTITELNSTKSMIELTSHTLENALSLKCNTLDTADNYGSHLVKTSNCLSMSGGPMEAQKTREGARRYVEGKAPSCVELKILEPCSEFHTEY